jgi:hypothetical protein
MLNTVAEGRGIDLAKRHDEVRRLVRSKVHFADLDPEELLQEVYLAILRKNLSEKSAWDERRAMFSTYVVLVAKSTGLHMREARRFRSLASAEPSPDVADERDPILAYEIGRDLGLDAVQFEAWLTRRGERQAAERQAARKAEQARRRASTLAPNHLTTAPAASSRSVVAETGGEGVDAYEVRLEVQSGGMVGVATITAPSRPAARRRA